MADILSRKERFNMAYNYLKDNRFIRTQKELAVRMDSTQPNVSSALAGDEKVLTDSFLIRFNASCDNIFGKQWLLTGEGEMLNSSKTLPSDSSQSNAALLDLLRSQQEMLRSQQETIRSLSETVRQLARDK